MAAVFPSVTIITRTIWNSIQMGNKKIVYRGGLNSFGGLKVHNGLCCLGVPVSSEQRFAKLVRSIRSRGRGEKRDGGAASSTCNAADEIFKIAAIMNGLVLIGVALGFVLLRIEAWLEESDQ